MEASRHERPSETGRERSEPDSSRGEASRDSRQAAEARQQARREQRAQRSEPSDGKTAGAAEAGKEVARRAENVGCVPLRYVIYLSPRDAKAFHEAAAAADKERKT